MGCRDGALSQRPAALCSTVCNVCSTRRAFDDPIPATQLYRLVRRYGLSYFKFMSLPKQLGRAFQRLYTREVAETAHATPQELLQAADLYSLTQTSFEAAVQVCFPSCMHQHQLPEVYDAPQADLKGPWLQRL